MITAYMKVLRTIQSADYKHLVNGSVVNLINNFGNMYSKDRSEFNELMKVFNDKLNMFEQSN
jgi:hypothetical protein